MKLTIWTVIGRERNGKEWLACVRRDKWDAKSERDDWQAAPHNKDRGRVFVLRPVSATLKLKPARAGSGEG